MKNSNLYIKIVFPRHLILIMLRIRDYKKTLAMYSYIWNSMYQNALHSGTQTPICIVRQPKLAFAFFGWYKRPRLNNIQHRCSKIFNSFKILIINVVHISVKLLFHRIWSYNYKNSLYFYPYWLQHSLIPLATLMFLGPPTLYIKCYLLRP